MERVTSTDGTELAVERSGSGPPLVCIHGTSATRSAWDGFARELEGMECVRYDRRGRGGSGDADEYALAREVEDARSVVEHVGDPDSVSVFGHSFGAIVAFELARETDLRRLVLYEPPVLAGDDADQERSFADDLQRVLEDDGGAAAIRTFRGMSEDDALEPGMDVEAMARTVVREASVVESYAVPERADITTPTRCLAGSDSRSVLRASTHAVRDAVPGAELVTVEGHGHNGLADSPGTVLGCVEDFLES